MCLPFRRPSDCPRWVLSRRNYFPQRGWTWSANLWKSCAFALQGASPPVQEVTSSLTVRKPTRVHFSTLIHCLGYHWFRNSSHQKPRHVCSLFIKPFVFLTQDWTYSNPKKKQKGNIFRLQIGFVISLSLRSIGFDRFGADVLSYQTSEIMTNPPVANKKLIQLQ